MNLKKAANVKNIVCLAAVAALGVGIVIADKKGGNDNEIRKKADSSAAASSNAKGGGSEKTDKSGREKVILAAEIPELSCESVDFGGNVIFASPDGGYSFMENGDTVKGIAVQDDSGAEVKFSKDNGKLVLTRDDQPAAGFVYENHMIELKDGKLYIDSSPVEYKATSFSSYRINKDHVIECTEKGKYRIKDSNGKIVKTFELKENTGSKIKIKADDEGFYTEGVNDGWFYNVYRLGDDLLTTTWENVLYINGRELVPYGYTDDHVDPDVKVDIDKIGLEPMRPPIDYGAAADENNDISSLTGEMLSYVNEVRKQYDMPYVYGLDELDKAADIRAKELAENFSHTRPDEKESSYNTVLSSEGMVWWRSGENIAKGGADAKEVFDSWISSEKHRAVMLDPDMKYLSLAKYEADGETYWELLMFNDSYVPVEEEAE
ncbi:CAP domain-containing protein [Ruminococcus sp.]|uniref:CAP domain-containing protein n=1 Tax=Ruminococcus sp. TaxID=41978 RepID=UPI00258F28C1|nr:CAP domain-containing protein [Ruminococcus sp.]MCR5021397.1 CAP domain-containing protein [Ruminococcus sp.]